jgi:hypothetical protein
VSTYADVASINPILLEHVDTQTVQKATYEEAPVLMLLPKNESGAGGKYYPLPVKYQNGAGGSATFSTAQSNQTPDQYAEFLLTRKLDYQIATITNEAMLASRSSVDAFKSNIVDPVLGKLDEATVSIASSIFRDGTGTIGTIATGGITSGVVTLTNPADVVQFSVGQTYQANATSGGTPRAALGYCIARSIRNGTVTFSATAVGGAAGSPSGWAAADSLLRQGDNNAKASGFQAWLPMTDPTSSDNYYGVNRSADYRLFGIQYDGSGQPIEEAMVDHAMLLAREGSAPDYCFTNYGSLSALTKALGTRRQYVDIKGPAGISFRAVEVDGPNGPIKVLADRSCMPSRAFMLKLSTWTLISLGPVPQILRYEDRLEMLRVYNSDAAEARIASYYNLGCKNPVKNGQLALSQ